MKKWSVEGRLPAPDLKESSAVLVDTPGLYSRMRFGYDRMLVAATAGLAALADSSRAVPRARPSAAAKAPSATASATSRSAG